MSLAVTTTIGNGRATLFWKDKWLEGKNIQQVAPAIFSVIPKCKINRCTVMEALTNGKWVEDIRAAFSARGEVPFEAVMEFMVLYLRKLSYWMMSLMFIAGGCHLQDTTAPSRPIVPSLREQSGSNLMSAFGNRGLPPSASFLCGWLLMVAAGLWIALPKEVCRTQPNAPCAIRVMRIFSTSWLDAFLQGKFGSTSSKWPA